MFNKIIGSSQPNDENNKNGLIKVSGCGKSKPRGHVVFVHGLAGHALNTWHWQSPSDKGYQKHEFWLSLLAGVGKTNHKRISF
jgi:hypothetical protein